jgi:hypothetical protein
MSVVGPTRTIFTARIAAAVKGKADFRPNDPLLKLPRGVDKNPPNTGKRPAANPQTSCHEPALISQHPALNRQPPFTQFCAKLRQVSGITVRYLPPKDGCGGSAARSIET